MRRSARPHGAPRMARVAPPATAAATAWTPAALPADPAACATEPSADPLPLTMLLDLVLVLLCLAVVLVAHERFGPPSATTAPSQAAPGAGLIAPAPVATVAPPAPNAAARSAAYVYGTLERARRQGGEAPGALDALGLISLGRQPIITACLARPDAAAAAALAQLAGRHGGRLDLLHPLPAVGALTGPYRPHGETDRQGASAEAAPGMIFADWPPAPAGTAWAACLTLRFGADP